MESHINQYYKNKANTMSNFDYDLFVIGAGSGGVRAARMSASMGAKVAVAEDKYLGGTCVNVGCVPKKLLVYASHFSEEFHTANSFGWDVGSTSFDWSNLIANKNKEIERLNGVYEKLLNNTGAEIINGTASLIDANTVKVADKHYTAKHILIATGGWPNIPDVPGAEHSITSNEAFFLDELPKSIVIVGGGYIAVEFAGIFNGMGVDTTLIYRGDLFMKGFDNEVRQTLAEEMQKKGITLLFNTNINEIKKTDVGIIAKLDNQMELQASKLMYAIGRHPRIQGLGLEQLGIKTQKNGSIVVDENYQTSIDNIYAVGDVTDRVNLTPVALAEGMFIANHLFNNKKRIVDYDNIPTCVFSQPNLGTVGLTEEQAIEKGYDIDVYASKFTPMKYSLTDNDEKTLMKLIVDKASDKVLGVHMLGPDAGEIMQGIAIAIKAGATKATFDQTIGIHPTAAEEFVTMRDARA